MPKAMHVEFGKIINQLADELGDEISSLQIRQKFEETYLKVDSPFKLETFRSTITDSDDSEQAVECFAKITIDGKPHELHSVGNGPINAFMRAMKEELVPDFKLLDYSEHSLQTGSGAQAAAYIQIRTPSGDTFFGAGIDTHIERASIKALLCALNRALQSHP